MVAFANSKRQAHIALIAHIVCNCKSFNRFEFSEKSMYNSQDTNQLRWQKKLSDEFSWFAT